VLGAQIRQGCAPCGPIFRRHISAVTTGYSAMISKVLSDAVDKIRDYLSGPAHRDVYIGATRMEIEALVAEMDRVRKKLDTPPP
jgi:hypothetical protein